MDASPFVDPVTAVPNKSCTRRGKRLRQQCVDEAVVAGVAAGPAALFRLPAGKLSQWLACPPCRLHDVRPFCGGDAVGSHMALQYAVVPSFFASQSTAATAVGPQMSGGSRVLRDAICKPPLRHVLGRALEVTRQSMGAVDDISIDSLLIVAFATTPQPRRLSCNRGAVPSVAVSSRAQQRLEVVGLCVCRELGVAYRMHSGAIPAVEVGCRRPAEGTQRWEQSVTQVGDTWCVGSSFCGVQFLWVAERHRRCGIGRMLVDLARQSVSYGFEIPVEHVAFAEPTAQGKLFLRDYVGRPDFLIF
ncbi:putative peroxisome targeting signal 1 receptor [Trypanosoma grayi]|uniref:putative peroxisome targeting signal 1 receptor n=1 Tax=Trypanosoma grayi TaxID=71804 RepID=UPI0004F4B50E|nr:putative peroxisome targeting signal 1 receptor [Trypanosoma grayi]KEG15405.1 putative peroxisome targeting signal 1 receptor [Trypanosoma grayi]